MPDATELDLTTPQNARSLSVEPMDEDGDGKKDEDLDDDVNGDGHVVQMRVRDPNGDWKVSDKDPRLMVRRRPGEAEGPFYRVMLEGKATSSRPPRRRHLTRTWPGADPSNTL